MYPFRATTRDYVESILTRDREGYRCLSLTSLLYCYICARTLVYLLQQDVYMKAYFLNTKASVLKCIYKRDYSD